MICATWSLPYLLPHVLDHLAAAVHAEVDIDIRHRHALRIQEALKQQLILQRIDVRDLHHVRHQRPRRRSTPRPHRNVLLLRVADKVPHDHEVAGKLHLLDAVDLALQPRLVLRNRLAQNPARFQVRHRRFAPLPPTRAAHLLEVAVDRLAFRHIELRKRILHLRQLERAALRKLHRARADLRCILKQPLHLLRALDVELLRVELEALRIVHRVRGLHAQQHLVRARVLVLDVVRVVRRNQRNVQVLLQPEHRLAQPSCPAPAHGPESRGSNSLARTAPRKIPRSSWPPHSPRP